uniref:Claudin n=1 Tax=Ciona savignyi TaxID=51511 RepID=H2YTY4_CIOSA
MSRSADRSNKRHSSRSTDRSNHRAYYDSNDSYRSDYSNRRVPGLVADPDRRGGYADESISRGQRSTMDRYNSRAHDVDIIRGNSRTTKDTMVQPKTFNHPVSTVTHYNPISHRDRLQQKKKRRPPINPTFLAILPGTAGVALLIAAIIIVDWSFKLTLLSNTAGDIQETRVGLFQACFRTLQRGATTLQAPTCQTVETFSGSTGQKVSDLAQATRAMMIISAIIGFASMLVNIYFGLNRWERERGALFSGGVYCLAGCCGTAGMACYSAIIVSESQTTNIVITSAGTSFYLGWAGAAFLLISSVLCFLAHCARKK